MTFDLARLGPDAFRRNGFGLLGLPTDAGPRRIRNAAKSSITAISIQDEEGLRERMIGQLGGIPDEPSIREAVQRLQEPASRLIDELLWFRTDANTEDSLDGLRGGDGSRVADVVADWHEDELSGESDHAVHNLAVFYHALAVELESRIDLELGSQRREDGVLAALRDDADLCWGAALQRWRSIIGAPRFWQWTRDRIVEIGADRIDEAAVAQLQKELPVALLTIPGRLMVRSFERGRLADASRLKGALTAGATTGEVLAAALNALAQPAIERLRSLTDAFPARIDGAGIGAKAITEQLIADAVPLLALADWLLGDAESSVKDLHEAFARQANRGQIIYWKANDTGNEFCVDVLRKALLHARAADTIKLLKGNLQTLVCGFCPQEPAKPGSSAHAVKIQLYKITSIKFGDKDYQMTVLENADKKAVRALVEVLKIRGPQSVGYSTRTILVPRCDECAAKSRSRGAEKHESVAEDLRDGWKIGTEPSDEEVRHIDRDISRRGRL